MSGNRLERIKKKNDTDGFHVQRADVRWLIDELRAERAKRAQCEDTIATLLAECKRLNAEVERRGVIEDAAIALAKALPGHYQDANIARAVAANPRPETGDA